MIGGLAALSLGGCEVGKKQSTQTGYRGSGMEQIVDLSHVAKQAAITDANTSFINSAVNARFSITQFCNINNYNESNKTFDQMLSGLENAAFMHTWRDSQKADLVAIFRDDSGL
eukprot:gene3860-5277_t